MAVDQGQPQQSSKKLCADHTSSTFHVLHPQNDATGQLHGFIAFHASQPGVMTQVGEDEAAGIPAVGIAREGGDSASARKCTFMELALCLAPGLDLKGISILYKSAKPALQVSLLPWCASPAGQSDSY